MAHALTGYPHAGNAVVYAAVEMQPDLRARLRKLRKGAQLVVLATFIHPMKTFRMRPDVYLEQCWVVRWPK